MIETLESEPLASFLKATTSVVDYDTWWSTTQASKGGMVGSGTLKWPTDRAERVAMQIALCKALARKNGLIVDFAHDFCYAGYNSISAHISKFAEIVLVPLVRDIGRLAEKRVLSKDLLAKFDGLPPTGDTVLDDIIHTAVALQSDPAPSARRLAVEKLWDAWERLKTLDNESNKKLSVEALLSHAADNTAFRDLLSKEARDLTDIGNSFHIRHFEKDRTALERPEHFDYLFSRMFALLHLLLTKRGGSDGAV